MPASLPGSCFPQNRVFFFISASPRLGWPYKDGQMDTWRPWCGGGMLVGSCRDLWVYGMLCAVCRVDTRAPHLPSAPRRTPCLRRASVSPLPEELCSAPELLGLVIPARHSRFGVLCPILQPTPLLEGTGLGCVCPNPTSPQEKGAGGEGWRSTAPSLGGLQPGYPKPRAGGHTPTPKPKPQSPNPPGLSVSQLRGFQTSRWRCAITRWEPGSDTRLRSWNTGNAHREHNPGDCCSDSPHRGCWDGLRAAEHSQEQGKGKWDPWQGR